jgi:hypothetical protein
MELNEENWRPITFQGVTFPPTLMGISILEPTLGITDEEVGDWLWQLTVCCGVTKRASADRCVRCAQRTIDLMLEHQHRVLNGIRDRLGSHGFDAENTYRDWILALQHIVQLSKAADGDCSWSAPMHLNDKYKSSASVKSFLDALNWERTQLRKTKGEDNQTI